MHFFIQYLKYKLFARHRKGHGIHSPFVFQLLTRIIEDNTKYPAFEEIEELRKKMLNSNQKIQITDFGAGSKRLKQAERKIKNIVRFSGRKPKYGRMIFRLIKHFNPQQIVETGTSLGIGTAYLAKANPAAQVFTCEGCPESAKIAQQNFNSLQLNNVKLFTGDFSTSLPHALNQITRLDFAVFDGNHRQQATIDYFTACLPYIQNNTVFIFDDIHWSKEMEKAWQKIIQHPEVTTSIDIFFMGLVFFRKQCYEKQHFRIRF